MRKYFCDASASGVLIRIRNTTYYAGWNECGEKNMRNEVYKGVIISKSNKQNVSDNRA